MSVEKEKRFFRASLWIFLTANLVFYISYLSSGRLYIASPVWLMLLLLATGFIVFLFLPYPGSGAAGPPGERRRVGGWYPRTLADIVEGEGGGEDREGSLSAPRSAIAPLPLIPLLLLLLMIILSSPMRQGEERWREGESGRLTGIYGEAAARISRLESDAGRIAGTVSGIVRGISGEKPDAAERAALISSLDSMAAEEMEGSSMIGHPGIQIISRRGEREAWGGTPRYLVAAFPRGDSVRTFTSRTPLYTLLVHEESLGGGGKVVVDIPLEVNYRISNRFLQSTGLGEVLSREYGEEVEYTFWMGTHSSPLRWDLSKIGEQGPRVTVEDNGTVKVFGIVKSLLGEPIAQLRIRGESYQAAMDEREDRMALWAGLILALNVIIVTRWVYRTYARRRSRRYGRLWNFSKRILFLCASLVLIRFILLRLEIPSIIFGTKLFDPALFADDLPAGLTRTAGDFLITSLFCLILVFGCVKAFRTYYGGALERNIRGQGSFNLLRLAGKTVLIAAVIMVMMRISSQIVSRVVLNSNPRLIGFDTEFFRFPVLSLHLALLFSVSAIFITAIFLFRLILTTGNGPAAEGLAAALAALGLSIILFEPHWALVAASAALLALSARIFPMLRKEEALSIIFSSFFLVLICSLVIYGIGSQRYDELRKGRVIEKLQGFNYPEDNWLMIVLPDLCDNISYGRSEASKVLTGRRSAAFEIWAESELSSFNLSCVLDVYDSGGRRFSRFAVGMPFEVMDILPEESASGKQPETRVVTREMDGGKAYFLIGYAPVFHLNGDMAGRVEIIVPYFFDNPEMLVRAGPMTPEIFQNIGSGTLAPRIDEPENLLVARIREGRVEKASSPDLPVGMELPGEEGGWFDIRTAEERFVCISGSAEDGAGFLVGYRASGLNENILQWAMVVSLDVILTVIALAALLVVRKLPVLGSVTPAFSLRGGLSFRRKLLLSFLMVSVLPVMLMGIFSGRYIRYRFRAEGDREAVSAANSAESFIKHSIRAEAEAFSRSQYLGDILAGRRDARIRDVSQFQGTQFTLIGSDGELLLDESLSDFDSLTISGLIAESGSGRVTLTYNYPYVYGGTVIRVVLPGSPEGHLYYRRRLDDEYIRNIAGVLGRNLNLYYDGLLRASSERELFTGGLLNPLLSPAVFADVALGRSRINVQDQKLGEYSYKVASTSLPSLHAGVNGVLSIPLLYRTAVVRKELVRSYALIMGLLALLFSAAVTLGVFLAGKIINPIAALRGGTNRIIEGDLEFRLEAEAQDEIGDLVNSFNTMTEALRLARRDLLERQRYLAAILGNIATGVISAGSDGTIMTVNPSGERILGIEGKELIGKRPADIGQGDLRRFLGLLEYGGEEIRESEAEVVAGGRRRTVKTVVTSLYEGGERLGTVVVFDDLTELIRTKKLSAWVEMARQIAHEVKNPLTPIKLSVQLMRRAYRENREEFADIFEEGVETVIRQTEILRRIASEFSSFGKAVDLKSEEIDLEPFIEEIIAAYRGVETVDITFAPGGELRVMADREAVRKILVNLIENALDAMPDGGDLGISAGASGSMAEIIIVDSGTGLPAEVAEKLFEPYFSTKTTGTGLGLAISQSLAREMDGDIVIRNRTGAKGVKAIVRLPLA